MTETKNQKSIQSAVQGSETALMIDGLYNYLSRDLQKLKTELSNELKYSALQTSSMYSSMQKDSETLAQANEKAAAKTVRELRYTYQQNQAIYEALVKILNEDVVAKLEALEGKPETVSALEEILSELSKKLDGMNTDALSESIKDKVIECFPAYDEVDYEKITESVAEKTEASVAEHSRTVLEAVAAIPVAENVDYTRIVEEVGDRLLEIVSEFKANAEPAPAPAPVEFDYDRVVYETAEKVVESLPAIEKLDYARMEENFVKAAEGVKLDEDAIKTLIAEEVQKAVAAIDVNAIAEAVASKIVLPEPQKPEEFDYDRMAILIMAKMPVPQAPEAIDYDKLADMVAERLKESETEATQEVVIDKDGAAEIASEIGRNLDLDALASVVAVKVKEEKQNVVIEEEGVALIANAIAEKLSQTEEDEEEEEVTCEMSIDEEGIDAIAEAVAKKLCEACASCELPVEEVLVEEVQEEQAEEAPVEEQVEEPAPGEEAVEEVVLAEETPVEEAFVEEVPAQEPAQEELAASAAEAAYQLEGNELVDAETGLVMRLKKSFTAKLKQSEDTVKSFYSELKNGLTSYKKVNSNVSWHGDRFNYGRETVARINIVGKTLGLYLALDPESEEFKTTVYHQKNVGNQKAYENTPFMVKVKSEAAVKKALRLVAALAEKLGAEKQKNFTPTDYVQEYAFATTQELLDDGQIKVTKEKKVALDF